LKSEFEHIGGVVDARVIYERENPSRSRGYGYVDFKSQKYADKAVKEMHGKEIDGREINVDISTSKPAANGGNDRARKFGDVPSNPSETLFLGNLSFDVDRDEIYKMFEEFGNIISVRLPTHPETQQLKGFGYVQYGDIESAKNAFENLQGTYIANRPVRLDYSTPKPPSAGNDRRQGGFRGNDRGGFRGNDRRQGNRGERNFSSGANSIPLGSRNSAPFSGQKKTFD
jgi:nucleolin